MKHYIEDTSLSRCVGRRDCLGIGDGHKHNAIITHYYVITFHAIHLTHLLITDVFIVYL